MDWFLYDRDLQHERVYKVALVFVCWVHIFLKNNFVRTRTSLSGKNEEQYQLITGRTTYLKYYKFPTIIVSLSSTHLRKILLLKLKPPTEFIINQK